MDNYSLLVERISHSSNLPKEEIERKIEAKRAKLSHLVSKEGAAQIVAAELGINLDQERLKLSELMQGMKRVNVIGKILQIFPVREYSKNNREGKVANFIIADETSNARAVLWDTNHIALIEKEKIKQGDIVEISGANLRNGEIHLSSFADIKLSKEKINNVITERIVAGKKLRDIRPGESISSRAFIVQTFEPRYFEVCPQCSKKVIDSECKTHGQVKPSKRALLTFVIDDGSESLRAIAFGEQINELGLTNEQIFSLEEFAKIKTSLLGEEKIFQGQIRNNALYNTTELILSKISSLNPDAILKELENSAPK